MADRVIKMRGEFDASGILASLKQIRDQAEKSNISDKLLGSYDKDLAKIEKLTTQYLAQIQKGFTKDSDVKSFSRILEQLENAYSVIAVRAEQFGDVSNFSTQTKEVKALAAQLKSITSEEAKLTKAAEDYIQAKGTELKLNKSEIEGLKKSVKEAEALREKIDEITAAKKAAAQQSIGRVAIKSEAGQAALAEVTHDNFNFGVASRKTPDKERKSLVRGSGESAHFDTLQAQATAMKEYNHILEETMTSGKTASDAVEAFTEIMKHYRLELTNANEIQKNFEEDMAKIGQTAITNKDALSSGDKTKVTKATNTIKRADQISGIADAPAVTNLQQQIQALVTITQNLAAAQAAAAANAERNAAETSKGMTDAVAKGKDLIKADREEAEVKRDQIKAQDEFNETFDRLSNGVKQLLSIGSAFRQIRQVIKQTYDDVKNLDKSFAEIAMVTSYSVEDMWSMYPQYQEMANRLGQTTQSVVQASGLFYQQGLDTAEALQLTEDTMKLATLAGLDFKDATSQMTAALRAFHMDMSEGAHVTDVYAEIAAHAAVDVAGLSDAMSATAAIANSAGMSFENTSAMLATMVEATQEAPKNLGTAMKTIIARFTELKENVAGTADSEFDDLDYNKVDKALKSVGVSLKDTNGQFRNMDEVFFELSSKWNTLDRNTQRYIATIAAGSRQQSRFIALMENYDRTMQLVDVAQNSAGKSSEQFAKYQDTLEYKVTQLKNSWEALRMSFTDSAFFKGAVGQIGNLVSTISKFDKKQVLSIGLIGITLGKSIITNFIKSLKDSTTSVANNFDTMLDNVIAKVKGKKLPANFVEIEDLNQVQAALEGVYGKTATIDTETARWTQEYLKISAQEEEINTRLKDIDAEYDLIIADVNKLGEAGEKRKADLEKEKEQLKQQTAELRIQKQLKNEQLKTKGIDAKNIAGNVAKTPIDPNSTKGLLIGGAKSAVTSAFTTALVMAIGGSDVTTALKAAALAGATSAIPTVMSLLGKAISSPHGAIVVAGIAAVAAIGYAIYKYVSKNVESAIDKAENRLEAMTKRAEEIQSKLDEARSETSDQKKAVEDLEKLQTEYIQLNGKVVKTTEEQERYAEIVSQIREQYPEIVTSYDEVTGKLQVQNDLWDNILEKQKASAAEAAENQLFLSYASAGANYNQAKAQYDLTNAQLDAQVITDEASRTAYAALSEKGINTGIDDLKDLGLDVDKLSESLSIDVDTSEGKEELLETIAAFDNSIENLKEIGIEDAEVKKKYIRDNKDSIDNQKKANKEYLKQQQEILKRQKEQAASEYIQNKYGVSEAVANFEAFASQTNVSSMRSHSKALKAQQQMLKQNDYNSNATAVGASTGAVAGAIVGSVIPVVGTAIGTAIGTGIGGFIGNQIDKSAMDDLTTTWDELSAEQKKAYEQLFNNEGLKKEGETVRQAYERLAKDGDLISDYEDELLEYLQAIYDEDFIEKLNKTMAEQPQLEQSLQKFAENYTSLGEEELNKAINEVQSKFDVVGDEDISEYATNYMQRFKDQRNTLTSEIKTMLGGQVTQDLTKYGIDQLEAYKERLQSIIDKYGVFNGQQYDQLMSNIERTYHLTSEQASSIFMTDWSAASAVNAETFKHDWVESMREAGVDGAEEIYNILQPKLEKLGIIDITISNTAELDEYFDTLRERAKTAFGEKDNVISLINSQAKEGKITLEEYYDAIETIQNINPNADINDYLNIDDTGKITANTNKIKQLYLDSVALQKEELEAQKEKTQAELDQVKQTGIVVDESIDRLQVELNALKVLDAQTGAYDAQAQVIRNLIDNMNQLLPENERIATIDFTIPNMQRDISEVEEWITTHSKQITEERIEQLEQTLEEYAKKEKELGNTSIAFMQDWTEEEKTLLDGLKETWENNTQAEIDALKALKDAQDDVIDKQKELNEALYGEENRNAKNGGLFNYTTMAERYAQLADKAKSKMEDLQPGDNANAIMEEYLSNVHNEAVIGTAEKSFYQQSINNGQNLLDNELQKRIQQINKEQGVNIQADTSDLYQEINGRYSINYDKLNALKMPPEFKDFIEDQIKSWNDYADKIDSINDQIEKRQKEFRDMQKKGLSDIVNLQEEMKNTLKEKYEQEIQDLQDKYDAMTDADTDYLDSLEDAIEKERKLREKQNAYDDLAQKEKKLSLMQRDTSGANQLEVQNLENEIQDDREQLLDDAINEVIDGLKEIYELQQESRDAEIEYRESLLTDAALMREVQEALDGINTADELVQWFYDNTANLSEMSAEQIQLEEMNWKDLFDNKLRYMETSQAQFDEALQIEAEEITTTTENLSQTLTTEAENSLNDITETVNENIKSAKDSLADALDTLAEKTKAYTEAVNNAKEAEEAYTTAKNALLFGDAFDGLFTGLNAFNSSNEITSDAKYYTPGSGSENSAVSKYGTKRTSATIDNIRDSYTTWTSGQMKAQLKSALSRGVDPYDLAEKYQNYAGINSLIQTVIGEQALAKNGVQTGLSNRGSYNKWNKNKSADTTDLQKLVDAILPNWLMMTTNQMTITDLDKYTHETKRRLFQMLVNSGISGYLKGNTIYRENPGNGASPFNHDTIPFKTGGLVNYTGPAWVDGSPSRPEAFLSADDTEMIGSLVDLLQELTFTNRSFSNMQMSTVGDTTIELTVNFDSVSEDYDSDRVIELMQQKIVEAANYTGSNVILHKR